MVRKIFKRDQSKSVDEKGIISRFLAKFKGSSQSSSIEKPQKKEGNKKSFSRDKYGYTAQYLTKNGKPFFPIMGEMHYARTNRGSWREEMVKMKSCGIDTISTYIFWIYHEQIEGQYDFSGNLDIREFIETADELDLKVWIRIGPFVHAELRNGGFPDWLLNKCSEIRCNDEAYMAEVTKYLKRLYEELEGLFYRDGGPIIAIQLENELGHVGGGERDENEEYLNALKEAMNEIGYDAPYYTATGWGGATIGDCIPVMGGYCDSPWERSSEKLDANKNYVITKERDDHMIGFGEEIGAYKTYKYDDFPFITSELGGGLCVMYRRRPAIIPEDIGAISLVKLANGCNALGYYMFHGGICPKGISYPLNETIKTGSWCDLPEFDYNFLAPIGSYGEFNDTYKELKLLFMFLKDFGEDLCSMEAEIECKVEDGKVYERKKSLHNNFKDIRHSVRHNGKSGYLFINNYVKDHELEDHVDVSFKKLVGNHIEGISQFLKFDIDDEDYFIFPFNLKVGDVLIKNATATPLCTLKNSKGFDDHIFLYGENTSMDVIYGKRTKIEILTKDEALNATKIRLDRDYLFITDGHLIVDDDKIILYSSWDTNEDIIIYPKNDNLDLDGYEVESISGDYSLYKRVGNENWNRVNIVDVSQISEDILNANYLDSRDVKAIDVKITLDYDLDMESGQDTDAQLDDILLDVSYSGDILKLIVDGEIVNDNFNNNEPFTIGLREYGYPKELVVRIYGLDEDNDKYFDIEMDYENGFACELTDVETSTKYKRLIHEG